jgi:thymidylate synthase (FAD)
MIRLLEPAVRVVSGLTDPLNTLKKLEAAARICYQSEPAGNPEVFLRKIIKMGHESVIEHHCVTVLVQCSRACAQQWTRHRLASYSMESQRYVDYSSEKHGSGEICFILPKIEGEKAVEQVKMALKEAASAYSHLRSAGLTAEDARSILPNATATHFYATANLREWRHFIQMRTDPRAQVEIRNLAKELHAQLMTVFPCIFDDIVVNK